jgi:hypothetical protein
VKEMEVAEDQPEQQNLHMTTEPPSDVTEEREKSKVNKPWAENDHAGNAKKIKQGKKTSIVVLICSSGISIISECSGCICVGHGGRGMR